MERFCKKVNVIGMLEMLIWLDKKACVGDATNATTVLKWPGQSWELLNNGTEINLGKKASRPKVNIS